MAHKRMFSKDITTSDAFREMPSSSQALYFHLGMEADDDGFLDNYKGLIRAVNASEDDLKVLIGKRFLIVFPSKVVVVKHWLINNTVRSDRYHETKHLEEKRALIVKENGAYTELTDGGIPSGNQTATQYRIGEDRIVGVSDETQEYTIKEEIQEETDSAPKRKKKVTPEIQAVFDLFDDNPARFQWKLYESERGAADILYREFGIETLGKRYQIAKKYRKESMCPQIYTPSQFLEKMPNMENFLKTV